MKRLHIHVGVQNLEQSIKFYSALFGQKPIKEKPDYAKWLLEDPSVNFAISTKSQEVGLNHLGIQVDDEKELIEISNRLKSAEIYLFDEGETVCCYSKSDKAWAKDPAGIPWEAYRNMADAEVFSEPKNREQKESACCAPDPKAKASSCCG